MLDLGGAIGQGEVAVTDLLGQGQGPLSQVTPPMATVDPTEAIGPSTGGSGKDCHEPSARRSVA